MLTISSSEGKVIEEWILLKSLDQVLIDCRLFKTGMYLCKIQCGKNLIGTSKFTVIR
jgi:hypothetical protein